MLPSIAFTLSSRSTITHYRLHIHPHYIPDEVVVPNNLCTFIHGNQIIVHIQLKVVNHCHVKQLVSMMEGVGGVYLDVLIQVKLPGNEEGHIFDEAALVSIEQEPTLLSILEGRRVEPQTNSDVHHPGLMRSASATWMYFEPKCIS